MNHELLPTGSCWCGCGGSTSRGNFFLNGHDRIAVAAVLREMYGDTARFLAQHGFGPGGLNAREVLGELRPTPRPVPRAETQREQSPRHAVPSVSRVRPERAREVAKLLWSEVVSWHQRFRTQPVRDDLAQLACHCNDDELHAALHLIARHCVEAGLPPLPVFVQVGFRRMPLPGLPGYSGNTGADYDRVVAFNWAAVANPFA